MIGPSTDLTFNAPIARVKPAFVSTLASMGMMITSIEVRGGREVMKARKAGRIMRQGEKLLAGA